ncbi:MAG: ROK family protein [Patescibacteria group bacterium]|nr:ROK family protein [Patescibacteria group bacterium]
MPYRIGVDVGATKIAAGIVAGGRLVKSAKVATPKTNRRDVIATIAKLIRVFDHPKVTAVGVGIAGAVDAGRGIVYASPNLPKDFRDVKLAAALHRELNRPVAIENDAKCFTFAEATAGVGRQGKTVVGFTIGSGLGFGAVVEGKILHGRNGIAGEFGHTTVVEHGLRCSCGQAGHLESYASGGGMCRFYHQLTGRTVDTFELERLYQEGEIAARRTLTFCTEILALGIANAIAAFNPDIVILGGGMIRVPVFWRPAIAQVKKLVPYPAQLKDTPVVKTKLGDSAGIIGAALAAAR